MSVAVPSNAPPPPPRPDPVSFDLIYQQLTAPNIPLESRAYHLVALNTVAYHSTVKLLINEHTRLPLDATVDSEETDNNNNNNNNTVNNNADAVRKENRARREALLRGIAFFIAQRNNPIAEECRWETISLLGELCRIEGTASGVSPFPSTASSVDKMKNNNPQGGQEGDNSGNGGKFSARFNKAAAAAKRKSEKQQEESTGGEETEKEKEGRPQQQQQQQQQISEAVRIADRLNRYAVLNMEFLASLPWFKMALMELVDPEGAAAAAAAASSNTGSSSTSSSNRNRRGNTSKGRGEENGSNSLVDTDEDVVIAGKDFLAALPTLVNSGIVGDSKTQKVSKQTPQWSESQKENLLDLMFLDASVTYAHLIPLVSRSSSILCSNCNSAGTSGGKPLSRCGNCKSVFYCSPACQKEHWVRAHKVPCNTYKEIVAGITAQYYALNTKTRGSAGGKRKGGGGSGNGGGNNSDSSSLRNTAFGMMPGAAQYDNKGTVSVLEVPLEPSLFFETRRYLYDHRDPSFAHVQYDAYFMEYTTKGN